ncbi:hypothetical protein FHETE_9077 [Fusarium heterosporum]|uniref:Uncharacterized protein n=1 Tax=Fusarium heterosporum TaxID=42747 RepID=A0A8H5WHF1_FUSHE|nr:hypothetical protein FHETE_9077 [Fusarium heterosporum]
MDRLARWLHERLQALVRSAFAVDHAQEKEQELPTPRTISINTRLMWDILLYNLAAYRGTAGACQTGSLFDASSLFPEDNIDEGEDIVEMDDFHSPTVEVTLSNGQALPPRSGRRMNRGEQDSQGSKTHESAPSSSRSNADGQTMEQVPLTPWPVSLDMAYDPFFQFQDPGSSFFGTWEVGNL